MKLKIEPRWYGMKASRREIQIEQRLLRAYHKRLPYAQPGSFDPHYGPYSELYNKEVDIMQRRIRRNDVVLDIGAGEGRLVEAALARGAKKVIALEPDSRASAELRRKFGERIMVVENFAQDMAFLQDHSIDIVTFVGNSLGMMW